MVACKSELSGQGIRARGAQGGCISLSATAAADTAASAHLQARAVCRPLSHCLVCSDSDFTDDEILTAAAVSKPLSGGQGWRRSQAKHVVAAPAGARTAASLLSSVASPGHAQLRLSSTLSGRLVHSTQTPSQNTTHPHSCSPR